MVVKFGIRQVKRRGTLAIGLAAVMVVAPVRSAFAEPQSGTTGNDVLVGLNGASRIRASAGDDVVAGDSMSTAGLGTVRGIHRASANAAGLQGNKASGAPVFSPDGTKVAFESDASNLVPGDDNDDWDIYVKNLATGAIVRVSTTAKGGLGNGDSLSPAFSPDGKLLVFKSDASNLVPGDTNDQSDIFVKNLETGAIKRVSTRSNGKQGTGNSFTPSFSPDGRKVVFASRADNLVPGDGNGQSDIFVKDLGTNAIRRVSVSASGAGGNDDSGSPVFSPDGNKVAFDTDSTNLVAGDGNNLFDVFVKDLKTGAIQRVSTSASGGEGNGNSGSPVFSPDGNKVAFRSAASNLVPGDTNKSDDVFVKDLTTGAITRVSTSASGKQGNGSSAVGAFSPDGTKFAFWSLASNLVAGDTNGKSDVFVTDLATRAIERVSTNARRRQAGGESTSARFSPDGTKITFTSAAGNLVPGDKNRVADVFVRDLVAGTGDDQLYGGPGKDRLFGGPGADKLYGEDGNDEIVPGAGLDIIVFSVAPSATNVDKIVGYFPVEDVIWLSRKAFPKVGPAGALQPAAFTSGTTNAATTTAHRIIHNTTTGALVYDPDGTGAAKGVVFTTVPPGTTLDAAEFRVVN